MIGLMWTPSLEWALGLLVVAIIAFVVAWLWSKLLGLVWAVGADREKLLAFTNAPVRFSLVLWVWSVVVGLGPRPQFLGDPSLRTVVPSEGLLWELMLPAFFTIIATIWGFNSLRDMAGGLALSLTRPFRVGDEIATASAHGRVSRVGLTRVRMKTEHGALIEVPASELASETLRIAPRRGGALPIEIEVEIGAAVEPDRAIDLLRDHALLSAYADASVPVVVELLGYRRARIVATPTHPDDADQLRGDLASRAASLSATRVSMTATVAAVPSELTVPASRSSRSDVFTR